MNLTPRESVMNELQETDGGSVVFQKVQAAVRARDWSAAARAVYSFKWAQAEEGKPLPETVERAHRIALVLLTGRECVR